MHRFQLPILGTALLLTAACTSGTVSQDAIESPTSPASQGPTSTPKFKFAGTYLDQVSIGEQERIFITHVPASYDPESPIPLVFNLHGAGSNAMAQESVSNWVIKAEQEGFVVVEPQASEPGRVWLGVYLDELGEADMKFFSAMLDELQTQLNIDPNRIYATGLSNGGTMTNRLGCDLSEFFAAIAPVAGAHSGLHLCEVTEPVSVLAIHGTDDLIIPYEGNGSDVPSVHTWVEAWAARNGCASDPSVSETYPDVTLELWRGCDRATEVQLLTVIGGGHSWLGLEWVWEGGRYSVTTTATDAIWDFFASHPKQGER